PRADAGGKLPYDILLESCDPALVKMEMDLCWISSTGKDPLEYFRRYRGRFPMVHVKGLRKIPAAGAAATIDSVKPDITDVGREEMRGWKGICAQAGGAGIQHYFVEHDEPNEPLESLKASRDYLTRLKY